MAVRDALPGDLDAVRGLLRDYERSLGVDLCFQSFDAEVAGLPGDYATGRGGALLVADGEDGLVGCVALRRLDGQTCELKRLYVSPQARGTGLGRRLLEAMLARARAARYAAVRLDTLPGMEAAQGLYRAAGFVAIEPYRDNPVPGAMFFELRFEPEAG
jgi:ribosomal protein S18 acetylase RimI-like enzyme